LYPPTTWQQLSTPCLLRSIPKRQVIGSNMTAILDYSMTRKVLTLLVFMFFECCFFF
jgi:hypothetical protein